MTLIVLLFILGVLFLAVEVIVPGGILGSLGGLMLFGGCVMAFIDYGTGGGLIAVLVAVALTISALFIEFRVLPRTAVGKRAFLTSEITAVTSPFGAAEQELVGKSGEALTMLSPSGYVIIQGKRYEAFCQSGQIAAGTALEVIGVDNFRLIVSPITTH